MGTRRLPNHLLYFQKHMQHTMERRHTLRNHVYQGLPGAARGPWCAAAREFGGCEPAPAAHPR